MDGGDRILVAAGLTAAVVVGAFVLWGPGGAPRVRKRRGQIAGLQNLGRTCFLNTLLQALAACPAFIEWLRKYAKSVGNNSMITTLYTVIEVVNGTHESARGTPVCPLGVFQSLRAAGWVVPAEQQDAHELLHVLLSCIDEEVIAMSKKPGCLSDALGLAGPGGGARAWSALASPASPPSGPLTLAPRGDSTPATPSAQPARPASAAPPVHRPPPTPTDLALLDRDPEISESAVAGAPAPTRLSKGVSRSFCHLSGAGLRRWVAPPPPRAPPPPPPFRGTLASRLQCTRCNTKSPIRYDKFDSISLPLTSGSVGLTGNYSLAGLLRAFTAPEMVKGVRCGKCSPQGGAGAGAADDLTHTSGYTKHIRTVSFGKLPVCLCVHVSRVEWRCGAANKRADHVAFPETISLAPYARPHPPQSDLMSLVSGEGRLRANLTALNAEGGTREREREGTTREREREGTTREREREGTTREREREGWEERAPYSLVAVVVHVGGPRSGHFATYRRGNGFEAKRWWYTSDTLVHEVSLQEVLRCTAYMLFYERDRTSYNTQIEHF